MTPLLVYTYMCVFIWCYHYSFYPIYIHACLWWWGRSLFCALFNKIYMPLQDWGSPTPNKPKNKKWISTLKYYFIQEWNKISLIHYNSIRDLFQSSSNLHEMNVASREAIFMGHVSVGWMISSERYNIMTLNHGLDNDTLPRNFQLWNFTIILVLI